MDYANGKIYALRSPNMEKYYIGSCITKLEKRFYAHKQKRNCTSKIVIDAGDCYIELIENFPCNSKIELNKREGELQRQYKNEIVNCKIEGRTKEEYYEDNKEYIIENMKKYREEHKEETKEYCKNNKEHRAEYHKQYSEDNKEQIAKNNKQRYEENKEQLLEQHKQYREKNKEKIAEKQKQYVEDYKEKIAEYKKQYYQKNKLKKLK